MKKQIVLLWTAMLLLGSGGVYAQTFSGGEGTEDSPYLISSKEDMEELESYYSDNHFKNTPKDKYFLLTRDLTGPEDTITLYSFYFSGTFDGGGHEIAVNERGIFSQIKNATIKNLGVSGRITSPNCGGGFWNSCSSLTGSICGIADSSNIINCYNMATISYTGDCGNAIGGICGITYGCNNIINCYNSGNMEEVKSAAGGICDNISDETVIRNCFAANTVINGDPDTDYTDNIGRILVSGYGNYRIVNCYANSAMLLNGTTVSSDDATSRNGKDTPFSSFTNQSWIKENLKWDFEDVWKMSDINDPVHKGLPVLREFPKNVPISVVVSSGQNVTIYPNPVSTSFRIQGITEEMPLTITDISGKIVLKQTVYSDAIISVEHLPEGVYTIRVAGETVKMVKK